MLEELFSRETLDLMLEVERARTSDFLSLVKAAGLDPRNDFRFVNLRGIDVRGCDLRAFDFTGADLRGALIDENTLLPDVEFFVGAQVDFVEVDTRQPIVEVMKRIELSPTGRRAPLLNVLMEAYDSPKHVDAFLLQLAKRATSADELIELLPYWSEDGLIGSQAILLPKIADVLAKEMNRAEPRRKVGARSKWHSISDLVSQIEDMPISLVHELAIRYRRGEISIEALWRGLIGDTSRLP